MTSPTNRFPGIPQETIFLSLVRRVVTKCHTKGKTLLNKETYFTNARNEVFMTYNHLKCSMVISEEKFEAISEKFSSELMSYLPEGVVFEFGPKPFSFWFSGFEAVAKELWIGNEVDKLIEYPVGLPMSSVSIA